MLGSSNWLLITLLYGVQNGAYSALDSHGVASITFIMSRSSNFGFSYYIWTTLSDGGFSNSYYSVSNNYGVADWFNHFMHIASLSIFDLYGRGVIPMIALVVLVNISLMVQ